MYSLLLDQDSKNNSDVDCPESLSTIEEQVIISFLIIFVTTAISFEVFKKTN